MPAPHSAATASAATATAAPTAPGTASPNPAAPAHEPFLLPAPTTALLSRAASPPASPAPAAELGNLQWDSGLLPRGNSGGRSAFHAPQRHSFFASASIILASAGLAVLLAVLGMRVFDSAFAGGSAPDVSAAALPGDAAVAGAPFQVEVVDASNKPWMLTGASGSKNARVVGAPPLPPTENETSESAAENNSSGDSQYGSDVDRQNLATTFQTLPLHPPRASGPATSTPDASEMPAPSISAGASSFAPIDVGAIGAGPPEAFPPARPAAPAVAAPTAIAPAAAPVAAARRPEAAQPAAPLRTGATVFQPPMLVTQVNPSYPLQALQQHAQGDVLVRLIIGKDGVPRNLQVVRGNPLLVTAALGVIPRWRYKPALLNGQPTEAQTVVTVSFHLK